MKIDFLVAYPDHTWSLWEAEPLFTPEDDDLRDQLIEWAVANWTGREVAMFGIYHIPVQHCDDPDGGDD